MKQIAIILQARTGSTRLPNKVIKLLDGLPLLSHCIRRLKLINKDYPVVVATSNLPKDDPIEEIARLENVYCFRGSEEDVLDRYYQASKKFNIKYIIRATGDNPFVDPYEARHVIEYIVSHKVDYVSNISIIEGMGVPVGVGVDAFTFKSLERSWLEGHSENHREHVNEYILENPDSFRIAHIKCLPENSCLDLRLTVDTNGDFKFIQRILKSIKNPAIEISTQDIIKWWQKREK